MKRTSLFEEDRKEEVVSTYMRILIHTDEYYPTAQACSYRMRTMADAFIDQGDEVVVIASSTNKGNGKIEPRREKILYSPAIRMKKKTTVMRRLNSDK